MPFALVDRVRSEWWGDGDRLSDPAVFWVNIIGRLKSGVPIGQAEAEATILFRNQVLYGDKPLAGTGSDPTIRLLSAREGLNGVSVEAAPMLDLLMVAACMTLLIACSNVASLLLARSAQRQKEMATRQALGASRVRVARQLITESIVLSLLGGTVGTLISLFGVKALVLLISNGAPERFTFVIEPDWRVIVFTTALTLAAGSIAGLVPTIRGTRVDLIYALKGNEASIAVPSRTRWRVGIGDALVVLQLALSLVLLGGAGMLVPYVKLTSGGNTQGSMHKTSCFLPSIPNLRATPIPRPWTFIARTRTSGGATGRHLCKLLRKCAVELEHFGRPRSFGRVTTQIECQY